MAEIVNLGKVRKARAKREAEALAAGKRAQFGETRAARALREAREEERKRLLDGAKVERSDGGGGGQAPE